MQQKLVQHFLSQKAGAFGNNIKKNREKSAIQYIYIYIYIYLQRIFAMPAVHCEW